MGNRLKAKLKDLILTQKKSVRETAKILGVSKGSAYKLIKGYKIPLPKPGRPKGSSILQDLENDGIDILKIVTETNNIEQAAIKIGVATSTLRRFLNQKKENK